jgi:PIN domain nuclease of toxin-antitoxin system
MPMPEPGPRLVLDTHIWVWLMEGMADLKPELRSRIESCAREGELLVSAISIWEVGMLEAKGWITFEQECMDWVRDALSAPGIRLAPLEPSVAVASTRLPGGFHGDPADRIIVATARAYACPLVTADQAIAEYAKSGFIKVVTSA